jgi:opacity protein-like surface antigen
MKNVFELYLVLLLGSLAWGQSSAWAGEGQTRGFYVQLDIGGTVAEDVEVKEFLGPLQGVEVEFDPGVRLDLAAGYEVTPWFAVELQTGFSALFVERLKGLPYVDVNNSSFSTVPMLVNVRFQYPNKSRLVPYVGGGAGGAISSFYADDITDYQNFVVDGADSDAVFAYQGFAGLRFQINEKMSAGVVYKYIVTKGASWDVDDYWGPSMGEISFDDVGAHAASAFFSMRF